MDNSNTNNENKKSQAVNKPAEILKATLILALCTIALLGLYLISTSPLIAGKPYDDMDKVYLKGISLTDLTPDKLSEVMGKNSTAADYKSYSDTSPTGTSYTWSKGKYALEIVISTDGNLMSIKSNYNK